MTLKEAVKATGLSELFLRSGCKAGTVPHIMCGNRYMINMPLLMSYLNSMSSGIVK